MYIENRHFCNVLYARKLIEFTMQTFFIVFFAEQKWQLDNGSTNTLLVVLSVPPIHAISLIVNSGTELARFHVTDNLARFPVTDVDFLFDPDSCFL